MPFEQPFKNQYTAGDIIYGLGSTRNTYIKDKQFFGSNKSNSFNPIIDAYIVTKGDKNEQQCLNSIVPLNQDEFLTRVLQHSKYKSACDIDPLLLLHKGEHFALDNPVAIARKCKAGLYWAAQEQKFQVHFLLDDIDLFEVILKSNKLDKNFSSASDYLNHMSPYFGGNIELRHDYSGRIASKSITGSELRWIYRNKNDSKVQKTIQFWYKGRPCCPPWIKAFDKEYGRPVSETWLRYKPQSQNDIGCSLFFTLLKVFCCK